jgi:hypothetical protein
MEMREARQLCAWQAVKLVIISISHIFSKTNSSTEQLIHCLLSPKKEEDGTDVTKIEPSKFRHNMHHILQQYEKNIKGQRSSFIYFNYTMIILKS